MAIVTFNLPSISSWTFRLASPSEDFVNYFTGFYEDPLSYDAFDAEGKNITDEFYDATVDFYEDGDFGSIKDYVWDNDITLSHSGEGLYN